MNDRARLLRNSSLSRIIRYCVVAATLFLGLSVTSAQAFELVSADPAVNVTVKTAPSAVTLTFSTEVTDSGSTLSVRAPSGVAVDDGSLLIDGANALIGLKKLTESGKYTVTYQVMSAQGEMLEGTYFFNFDAPAVIASPSTTSSSGASPSPSQTQETPAGATGKSSRATDIFMISLLIISFLVLVYIGRSLRKPQTKKRKKK